VSRLLENRIFYEDYDAVGNLRQYRLVDGPPTTMLWGYNKQYPIAKLDNVTYDAIPASLRNAAIAASNNDDDNCRTSSCNEELLRDALQAIRAALPNALVTTYTYDPLIGVTSMTDPRGYTMYYEYDGLNRLSAVKDADGNLVSDYDYNYASGQ